MNEFLRYQKTIFAISVVLAVIAIVTAFVLSPENSSYSFGIGLGFVGGLIKYRLDVLSIVRFAQALECNQTPNQPMKASFQTLAIMGGFMIIALMFKDTFNLWTVFGGLLIPRLVLIADGILRPGGAISPVTASEDSQGENNP
jgi:Na+/H+-translocating membrane pyrophosphatase